MRIKKTVPTTNSNSIYEKSEVYGSVNKFRDASHRYTKMLKIINNLNLKSGNVLDMGCGTGYLASQVKKNCPHSKVFGADISHKAVKIGSKQYSNVKLIVADAERKFPFDNNFFELIISGEHIAHLKDTDTYLAEISRVLKKGGTLILTTPNLVSWFNRILMLFGKAPFFYEPLLQTGVPIISLFGTEFPNKKSLPSGHLRLFNLDMIKKSLKLYNITIIKSYGVSSLNNPLIKVLDYIFSIIPGLASGIIVIARKN